MTRFLVAVVTLALGVGGVAMGCSDDDDGNTADAGGGDGSSLDGGRSDATFDAGIGDGGATVTDAGDASDASDASTGTPWVLVTMSYADQSEMIVMSLDGGASPGRISYEGGLGMTDVDSFGRPFVLQEIVDRVVAVDPAQPWIARGSWDVRLNDLADGGLSFADPVAVVASSANKAYVVRFNRNRIAVIDPTQQLDGAAPVSSIDLSSLQDPTDTDTSVDPLAAVFANGKLFVLLANLDFNKLPTVPTFALCTATSPKVVAIDPATDTVQPVAIGASAGGVQLPGYNSLVAGMMYDAPRNRLLIVQSGCNPQLADAGPGALQQRQVDAVDLQTGTASKVLDLNADLVPTSITPLAGDEVVLGFAYSVARRWNVTTATLGPAVGSDLAAVTSSPKPQLFGARTRKMPLDAGADADAASTEVHDLVEVSLDGGATSVIGPIRTSRDGGVAAWLDYLLSPSP